MQVQCDKTKYKVKRRQISTDEYQFNVIPRKRTCKLCGKGFDSNGNEFITWTDDNGYLRSGYFCRKDFVLISKAIKLINKNR